MEEDDLVFVGDVSSKVIVINQPMSMYEMKTEIINRFINSDSLAPNLQFSHLHPFKKTMEPFLIENDSDLRSFFQMSEVKEVNWTLPLYATVVKEIIEDRVTHSMNDENQLVLHADSYFKDTYVMEDSFCVQNDDVDCINNANDTDDNGDDTEIESGISSTTMSTNYSESISSRKGVIIIAVGQLFKTKEHLKDAIALLAAQETFAYRVKKTTPSYYRTVCVDKSCDWKIHGAILTGSTIFQILKYNQEHSCSLEVRIGKRRAPNYKLVAEKIKPR